MGTIFQSRSSISCLPIIETINNDISEYIATNVISITDGQFYSTNELFKLGIRPALDSALSVTRIGSAAQCSIIKRMASGMKNELTNLRTNSSLSVEESNKLITLNNVFYQDHLYVSDITSTIVLLRVIKNGILFNNIFKIHSLLLMLSIDYIYLYYILFLMKTHASPQLYSLFTTFIIYLEYSL